MVQAVASMKETHISLSRSGTVSLVGAGASCSPCLPPAIAQQHSSNAQRTLGLNTVKVRHL